MSGLRKVKILLSLLVMALSLVRCLGSSSADRCNSAPADQQGSFMGRVANFPLLLNIDSAFTADQRQQLFNAVAIWNAAGRQALGHDIFVAQIAVIPDSDRTLNPSDCTQNFASDSSFALVREKNDTHWGALGFTRSVPGATFRCEENGQMIRQIVYLYPETVDPTQLSSVLLHELGHSIGLDHSCLASGSRSDFVSCMGLGVSHPYRVAVMFPWLHVKSGANDVPEIKDALRSNDQVRGSCAMGVGQ